MQHRPSRFCHLFLFLLLIALLDSLYCQKDERITNFDWGSVQSTLQIFLKDSSPDNARAFLDSLPLDRRSDISGSEQSALEMIYEHIEILESRVWAGDVFLAEAAMRLLNYSDGYLTECLGGAVAELARISPSFFLFLIQKYGNSLYIRESGYPLLFPTEAEAPAEKAYMEYESRRAALLTVTDEHVRGLRNECIKLLDERMALGIYLRPRLVRYHDIVTFFDLIESVFDSGYSTGQRNSEKEGENILKLMSFISRRGVEFADLNDRETKTIAYEDIKEEIALKCGISYEVLSNFYQFFIRKSLQLNKLQINADIDSTKIAFGSVYQFQFENEGSRYFLCACRRTGAW